MDWIVTGGAGFLGSTLVKKLNERGITEILLVDHLNESPKWRNLLDLRFEDYLDRGEFLELILKDKLKKPQFIIHLGAITNTAEKNMDLLRRWNVEYTVTLVEYACTHKIRVVYASSAAVYGDGSLGFSDSLELLPHLKPLNPYGFSKLWTDRILYQRGYLHKIVGIRYFNVYGPREDHKGPMRSVIPILYRQLLEKGKIRLFRSNTPEIADGEQRRDFVYVEDAVDATLFLAENPRCQGIYNIGTGVTRSFLELGAILIKHLGQKLWGKFPPLHQDVYHFVEWIPMPETIANGYQNYTCADLTRLRSEGYDTPFRPLEDGIPTYLTYLEQNPPSP